MARLGIGSSKPRSSRRGKKKRKPDPPGSSLSTEESLQRVRQRCRISEPVEFVAPEPFDRAEDLPPNHFTVYEYFFELCFRDPLPPVPKDIAQAKEILAARKVNWRKHFSFVRVEKARALFAGTPVSYDSSASSRGRERAEPMKRRHRLCFCPEESCRDPFRSLWKRRHSSSEVPTAGGEDRVIVMGLPSQSRPASSTLTTHKGGSNRKRSASDGDKGKGVTKPKKMRTILLEAEPISALIDDASASASLLSKINNKGIRLPPADSLMKAKSYASMSQPGTKFLASINETITGYEADASKDQRRIDEARKDAVTLQTKLDEAERKFSSAMAQAKARIKVLEAEKNTLKDECVKATDMAVRLEESRAKKDADIAFLQRQLTEKDALHEANIERAVKSARRDLTKKMRGRFSSAEKNLKDLADAKENELDLA
ncbi:uncharacterized protein At3g60930, chloroplastic-like [Eutrema salsugineum]|uniref:uncharacterized protein At3g60930, chloroplastic-like n=1 Tax=Eutrema salsugineum TaxID=72664 RepID=UPI000CECF102|nr:uncharacterized protein At3g60930, chloroplastic-like [Eutrema salsugineum]